MKTSTESLVAHYLRDLETALRDLPAYRRREIVDEIRAHIDEARTASPKDPTEAELRTLLDRVGDPESIAAEARERLGIAPRKAGLLEGITIALLLAGGLLLPVIGWVIGAVLLWVSRVWTVRDKVIGTLLVPGGLALPLFLGAFAVYSPQSCVSRPGSAGSGVQVTTCSVGSSELWGSVLLVALVLIPIATAVYLGRRAWRA